jgi:hypothetical protein
MLSFVVYSVRVVCPLGVITFSLSMNRRLTQPRLYARFYTADLNQFGRTDVRNNWCESLNGAKSAFILLTSLNWFKESFTK